MTNCPYLRFIASLSSLLLISAPALSTPASSDIPTPSVATQATSDKVRQIARSIAVKVFVSDNGSSGILIAKKGQVYTVLTNAHVVRHGQPYRIQTSDGKVYQAKLIERGNTFSGNDLALLEFSAKDNYAVATVGDSSTLKENEVVYTAGFPFDGEQLIFTSGKITAIPTKPLAGGYQIGYTNQTQQGMSGGPVLNKEGKLIGVVGQSAGTILNDAYRYQDGTMPTPRVMEQMRQSSFAVPIAKLTQVAPQLGEIVPNAQNQKKPTQTTRYTGIVKEIDDIAQQITVKIDSRYSGNGSGVIVAQQGQTYYVLTANHVVDRDEARPGCQLDTVQGREEYHIVTPDGQKYSVNPEKMTCLEGVDLAVAQFTADKTYKVANLVRYEVGSEGSGWVFVSGFPATKSSKRLLTAGNAFKKDDAEANARDVYSQGYGLYYTNASYRGMSGSPVLDRYGRVVGINTGAEDEIEIDRAGQIVELHLGYSLGVPIATFLGLASKTSVKTEDLKIDNSPSPDFNVSNLSEAGLLSSISDLRESKARKAEIQESLLIEEQLFSLEVPQSNGSALDWLNYGSQLQKLGRQEEAFAAFTQAIKLKPDYYLAYFARGLVLLEHPLVEAGLDWNKSKKALADFKQATKLQPNFYQGWRRQSQTLYVMRKHSEALATVDKAISIQPKDFNLYIQKGKIFGALKRYLEALVAYDEALKISSNLNIYRYMCLLATRPHKRRGRTLNDCFLLQAQPNNSFKYQIKGGVYIGLKEYQKAFINYNQAIELEPSSSNYEARGDAYFRLKDYQKAFADYTRVIELEPNKATAYQIRGDAYFRLKDYQKAFADYTKAIEIEPSIDNYRTRGNAYVQLKDYQKAIADYTKAIEIEPKSYNYEARGDAYFRLKDYQKAIADYTKVIELEPYYENYLRRGNAYFKLKNYQRASADYEKAFELNPELFPSRYEGYEDETQKLFEDYIKAFSDYNKVIKVWTKRIEIQPNNAKYYQIRGDAYFDLKDYDKAFADYTKAIEVAPNNEPLFTSFTSEKITTKFNAYLYRGEAYQKRKNYERAIADFTKAIELENDPSSIVYAYSSRGKVYFQLKKYEKAFADYNKAIELQPGYYYLYALRGNAYAKLKDYQKAIADFTQAIENIHEIQIDFGLDQLDKDELSYYITYYISRGNAYAKLKDYSKAVADYSKAIELQPNYAFSYTARGGVYLLYLNDYSKAIADYSKVIELKPNDVETYKMRGLAYVLLKDYRKAIADYSKVIELKPNDVKTYEKRGLAYFELKDYSKAIADYSQAIELNPTGGKNYRLRGDAYAELKDYSRAISDFTQAIELQPNDVNTYASRGYAYLRLEDYSKAIADYSQAIELKPDDVETYKMRGNAYVLLKDYRRAIADYSKAIERQPNDTFSYRLRGDAYFNLKDYQKAIADYSKVIELQPDDVETYKMRGSAYFLLKDYHEAIADFSKVIELQPNDALSYLLRGNAYYELLDYPRAIADAQQASKLYNLQNNREGYQQAEYLLQKLKRYFR